MSSKNTELKSEAAQDLTPDPQPYSKCESGNHTEETFLKSETHYRLLVENANDAIFIIQDNVMKFLNPKTERMTGYSAEELSGISFFNLIHTKDRENILTRHQKTLLGEKYPNACSFRIITRKEEELWVELNNVPMEWEGRPASLYILRDISAQKKIEEQFFQAQKMKFVGNLASGIAHDFNNLLMGIQGRTSLMLSSTDSSHPNFEHLLGIEEYIKIASDLCRQLLGFSRNAKYESQPTDINVLIKDQVLIFGRTRKEITICESLAENLWIVDVDPNQVKQVILNLMVNAWESMPRNGKIFIKTENIIVNESFPKPDTCPGGKYIKISITDTGVGMDEETRSHIFDPSFSNSDKGLKIGLGLTSVYHIIKNHNGFIEVSSEQGKGSTFDIFLAATEKPSEKKKKQEEVLLKGTETILLVDDEAMVIHVGAMMLKRLGYHVITAGGGNEALDIFKNRAPQVDMVILDMIMPGMGGAQTFELLKEQNPDVKVLLSSGYTLEGQAAEIVRKGCSGFIQKPFNMKTLSHKLREILDNRKE